VREAYLFHRVDNTRKEIINIFLFYEFFFSREREKELRSEKETTPSRNGGFSAAIERTTFECFFAFCIHKLIKTTTFSYTVAFAFSKK
jgi:hypothetical protein